MNVINVLWNFQLGFGSSPETILFPETCLMFGRNIYNTYALFMKQDPKETKPHYVE